MKRRKLEKTKEEFKTNNNSLENGGAVELEIAVNPGYQNNIL